MFQLAHPAVLLAAPALLWALLIASRRSAQDLPPRRRALALAVRGTLVLALLAAVSRPDFRSLSARPPDVAFVLDLSESVGEEALDRAMSAVERASRTVSEGGGRSALVAFAGSAGTIRAFDGSPLAFDETLRSRVLRRSAEAALRAAVERGEPGAEARLKELSEWTEALEVMDTRPSAGLLNVQALAPADSSLRTFVLTDGRRLRGPRGGWTAEGVAWIRLPELPRRDLIIHDLHVPPTLRFGEPLELEVDLETSFAGEISLALTVDDSAAAGSVEKVRAAGPGRRTLRVRAPDSVRSLAPGLHRLSLLASQPGEADQRNNQAMTAFWVVGRPKVLVVEGAPYEGAALTGLLSAQQIDSERISAEHFSTRAASLDQYVAIAMAGVPPRRVPGPDVAALRSYVENGGGLLLLASSRWTEGDSSSSSFAPLLPVEWAGAPAPSTGPGPDPGPRLLPADGGGDPKRVRAPAIALLLLIDKSGSMAGRNIRLAREACLAAASTLSPQDLLGVVGFDVRPHWIVEWTHPTGHEFLERQILRLQADGGTNIFSALLEAQRTLRHDQRASKSGVKHVILLSDGITSAANFEEPLTQMVLEGVTITTVCFGTGEYDLNLMSQIARMGRGRFLFSADFQNVPQIFTNEARFVVTESARASEAEGPAVPLGDRDPTVHPSGRGTIAVQRKDSHEVLKGVDPSLPPIRGLVGSRARPTAYAPLATAAGEPVLALWRFGLGKAAVWTSDLGGPWSPDWIAWPSTPRLFAQVVRHVSNASGEADARANLALHREGDVLVLRAGVVPGEKEPELHLLSPRRERIPLAPARSGLLEGRIRLQPPDTLHQFSLVRRFEDREERFPAAAALPYPVELSPEPEGQAFRELAVPPRSLDELPDLVSAPPPLVERRTDFAPWILLIAALLLPVDVALRRLR